jgi:hypothetical protein
MADIYTQGLTRDGIIGVVLRMLGVTTSGVTPNATQVTEAAYALDAAVSSINSSSLLPARVTEVSVTVASGYTAAMSQAGVLSLEGATFYTTTVAHAIPLEVVPASKIWTNKGVATGLPTRVAIGLHGAPVNNPNIFLDSTVTASSTVKCIVRMGIQPFAASTTTTDVADIPDFILRIIMLMTALDLAPSFDVDMNKQQLIDSRLNTALQLAQAGSASRDAGGLMRLAAAQQGTVPPPLTSE